MSDQSQEDFAQHRAKIERLIGKLVEIADGKADATIDPVRFVMLVGTVICLERLVLGQAIDRETFEMFLGRPMSEIRADLARLERA